MEEKALVAANKAIVQYNMDLELLFKSKSQAKASGDTDFVQFAFDQINVVAKIVTDAMEMKKQLESTIEDSKANVHIAETQGLPSLQSILRQKMPNVGRHL